MGSEPPLTERELTILRGMIDDHETRRIRRSMFGEWWRDGKVLVGALGFLILVTLELLQIYAAWGGH